MEKVIEVTSNLPTGNKITKRLSLFSPSEELKAIVVSESLPTDGLWAYASVEVPDAVGDVVKIGGVTWSDYHNPPNSYLKITAQHSMELQDGTPPIIGRVERFAKTKSVVDGKEVPALAFYMTWAKDGNGQVTELAKKYKDLFDGGYMDSFSVGLIVSDFDKNDSNGYDYKASSLYHIGAVTVPANPKANVVRSISQEIEGKVEELTKTIDKQVEIICKQSEMVAKMSIEMDRISTISKGLEDILKASSNEVQKRFDSVSDRLDYIEAGVVVKSAVHIPQTGDRKREDVKDLSEVSELLKKYSGRQVSK